jgi:hypothetical protein
MQLPIIADTIRVSVEGVLGNGAQWANIIHLRKSGVLTFAGAIALADPIIAHLWTDSTASPTGWATLAHTTSSVQRIRYTPLDGITATTIVPHVQAGTNSNDQLPPGTALVITAYTANRGRRYRGRIYLPALTEGSNDVNGTPLSVTQSSLTTAATNALITNLVGTGVSFVVASYGRPDRLNPSGWSPFATNVTSLFIDNRWDSQRRRSR